MSHCLPRPRGRADSTGFLAALGTWARDVSHDVAGDSQTKQCEKFCSTTGGAAHAGYANVKHANFARACAPLGC